MAEARSAVAQLHVRETEEGRHSLKEIIRAWRISVARRYYRTRNSIHNGMWPTSLYNLTTAFLVFLFLLLVEPRVTQNVNSWLWSLGDSLHVPQGLPSYIRAVIIACFLGFIFFLILMYIRRFLLRLLLSYRGWMYEPLHLQAKLTFLWALAVKLVSGYHPSLYSFQRSLPRMPVPHLKETLSRLLESLRPLCSEEELTLLEKQAKEFETTLGPKLQNILLLKSWIAPNYVSDWWEKYVYLGSRAPLAINSNYYCYDQSYWTPTSSQVARAAGVIANCLAFKRLVDREELPPLILRSTVPMCMAQYERMFSTFRLPGEEIDEVVHFESSSSKHVIVVCKGIFYKLDVYDLANQLLHLTTLEQQIQWIVEDAEKHEANVSDEERSIAALTTLDRTEWARIRKLFLTSGVNEESRDLIEKSIFYLTLLDISPKDFSDRGKMMLTGSGTSVWFDKSLSVQVFSNASCGMNCEHSMADAPVMAHMWEYAMTREILEKQYDETGHCMPPYKTFRQARVKRPQRLLWEVQDDFAQVIRKAKEFAKKNIDDLDMVVADHDLWGKGFIKKCKVSPDAFIQMALQLAYYKDAQKFVQTYEASMTRMYLCGRTETVRSCTKESIAFVMAMITNDVSKEDKVALLKKAALKHQMLYRDAMNGRGVDRHLFSLYVACKGLGQESEFLKNVVSRPWTLSTSQTPHTQLTTTPDVHLRVFSNKLSPGGGFGPVSDDGYGVSYVLPTDHKFFFHVSSKHSCTATNSTRFLKHIYDSLTEMRALFE